MKANVPIPAIILLSSFLLLTVAACGGGGEIPFGLKSELVTPADRASDLVFAPDGRIFYAEQFTGNIRVISAAGQLEAQPFAQVQVANYLDLDWGLTGLALDPDFDENHYLYAFLSEPVSAGDKPTARPKVVRFTDDSGRGVEETLITDDFPETPPEHSGYNANGAIHVGPDGYLYLSIGDYDASDNVQDLSNPIGKLLRVSKADGSAAPDNPYANQQGVDPRIFAHGFREPFDFIFQRQGDKIYGTDNTPYTCEELNVIEPGKNYGWPDVGEFPFAECGKGEQVQAIRYFAKPGMQPGDYVSLVEISGLAFVSAADYPALGDSLLICERGTSILRRLVLSGPQRNQVTADDVLVKDCKRDVAVSPDGTIYYSNDTEIRRLVSEVAPPS